MTKKKDNIKRKGNTVDYLIEFAEKMGELRTGLDNLTTHFTNHLSQHRRHEIFILIQTLVIISLFCYLKWGV